MRINLHHGKNLLLGLTAVLTSVLTSCSNDPNEIVEPQTGYPGGEGFFIVNEGTFGGGNGSLSFFSNDKGKVYHEVYREANGSGLGDVPVSMIIFGDTAAIAVNGSGRVEFVKLGNMKNLGTVGNLASPRQMAISGSKLLLSDLSLGIVHVIDHRTMVRTAEIHTGHAVEHLYSHGDQVYASAWSAFYVNKPNNVLLRLDPAQGVVTDSLLLSKEPNSMASSGDGLLWVLCSGGYLYEEAPVLYAINLGSFSIEKEFSFVQGSDYPSSLGMDYTGQNLYFLNQGKIWKMGVGDGALPQQAWYSATGYIYQLSCDPQMDRIVATDAGDFQSKGQ
ncbi:MAG: hypothetical protein IH599_00980, partial [Bacteroidales bacterium]|nr:hypothetical protein [Bacteroidales bacterium]